LNKTLAVYGGFGLFVVLQLIAVMMIGGDSNEVMKYIVFSNLFVLLLVIFLDSFGLFCILLAWFPFSFGLLKFELGIITFTPYTMGMTLLAFLSVYLRLSKGKKYGTTKIDVIIFFLCLSFLISTLLSNNLVQSGFFAFHALFVPVVSYFCVKNMVVSEKQYLQSFLFLMAGVVLFGVLAISPFGRGYSEGRLTIFEMPPISAAAILIWAIISLFILQWVKTIYGKISLVIVFVGFVRTLSKGYFAILLMSPLVNRIIRRGNANSLMKGFFVLSLVLTLMMAFFSTGYKHIDIEAEEDKSIDRVLNVDHWVHSFTGRGAYYLDGFKQFPKNPIFGVGAYKGDYAVVRHNFHVEWLEYGGLSMYLLYSSLFIIHFKSMGPYARYDKYIRANLVLILIFILNGLFNSFTVGSAPVMTYILFGFNEARRRMYLRGDLQKPNNI